MIQGHEAGGGGKNKISKDQESDGREGGLTLVVKCPHLHEVQNQDRDWWGARVKLTARVSDSVGVLPFSEMILWSCQMPFLAFEWVHHTRGSQLIQFQVATQFDHHGPDFWQHSCVANLRCKFDRSSLILYGELQLPIKLRYQQFILSCSHFNHYFVLGLPYQYEFHPPAIFSTPLPSVDN